MLITQSHESRAEQNLTTNIGQFEHLILTAILALRDDAYGVTIHAKAEELAAPKDISLGAVYVTLDRLEDKGLVSSRLSDPTPEREAWGPEWEKRWRRQWGKETA